MGVTSRVHRALIRPTDAAVERWAWASVVANTVIVLTGGLVRLTGSGLGCPTWPRCTDASFVPHRELGVHGVIEFGNRMLTYVLVAVAVGTLVAVWRWASTSRSSRRIVALLTVGIPFQGVVGGVTVLTDLNPWIVSFHLLLSMALIGGSVLLLTRVRADAGVEVTVRSRSLVAATSAVLVAVVYLGTVVTGSGPHAGDVDAPRNGLDPQVMSHVHAAAVYVLVALTVATVLSLRGTAAFRTAVVLLAVELLQGVVGFVQYATDLPVALVAAHLVGAATLVATAVRLALLTATPPGGREMRHPGRAPGHDVSPSVSAAHGAHGR